IRIAHVEESVLFEVRMKLDAVKAFLNELEECVGNIIEERLRQHFAILDDLNPAGPLADEEASGSVLGTGHMNRIDKSASDLDQLDGRALGKFAAGPGGIDFFLVLGPARETRHQ